MNIHDGIHARQSLSLSDNQLKSVVASGRLRRIARGWYATPSADEDAVAARAVGGLLTAQSLLRKYNVWLHQDSRLHVIVPPNASRLRRPPTNRAVCVHYLPIPTGSVEAIVRACQAMAYCSTHIQLVAAIDSCLASGLVSIDDLVRDSGPTNERFRRALARVRSDAGSGLESEARCLFDGMRLKYRTQVQIQDVGRVDFLIGKWLIVEIDGFEYHSRTEFHTDRIRDLRLAALGYRVVRMSAPMLRDEHCIAAFRKLIRQRVHLTPQFPQ